eukprot:1158402-Pelagomonas_calceolata.AAC.12
MLQGRRHRGIRNKCRSPAALTNEPASVQGTQGLVYTDFLIIGLIAATLTSRSRVRPPTSMRSRILRGTALSTPRMFTACALQQQHNTSTMWPWQRERVQCNNDNGALSTASMLNACTLWQRLRLELWHKDHFECRDCTQPEQDFRVHPCPHREIVHSLSKTFKASRHVLQFSASRQVLQFSASRHVLQLCASRQVLQLCASRQVLQLCASRHVLQLCASRQVLPSTKRQPNGGSHTHIRTHI